MKNVGKVFKNQFAEDYWTIVAENDTMFLFEATYFSGRPKKCTRDLYCPFKKCNYKRNQFCLSKKWGVADMKELQGGKLELEIKALKEEVIYSNWSQQVAGEPPPINRKGYIE